MSDKLPFVTIVIPAKDEEAFIGRCLSSLSRQDYPKDRFEIVVVDNMSVDETVNIAKQFGVSVLEKMSGKIGAIRNFGVSASTGEYIAFLDADCVAPESWISNGIKIFTDRTGVGCVGGYFENGSDSNWIQRGWAPPRKRPDQFVKNLATGSLFVPRKIFEEYGPFNETVSTGEDTEFTNNVWRSGMKLLRSGEVSVLHLDYPNTASSFLGRQIKQASNYLEVDRKDLDLMFIGVCLFGGSLAFGVVSMLVGAVGEGLIFFSVSMLCWGILSVREIVMVTPGSRLALLAPVFVTRLLYLVGRCIGLLIAFKRKLMRLL